MKWTPEQDAAIKTVGDNLLVAAGAGSGKTAVLVARILRMILGEDTTPCNVDRLLIVTFTKAAAQEMRQRLFEALEERLLDDTITETLAKRIYLQQTLLAKATITTIHGFCSRVVHGNCKESGIDGSFREGDEAEVEVLMQESAEEVCEQYSTRYPADYEALVDTYGSYRSDDDVVELVKMVARFSLTFPDPKAWIRSHVDQFKQLNETDLGATVWGQTLLRNLRIELQALITAVEQLYQTASEYQIAPYLLSLVEDRQTFKPVKALFEKEEISWEEARQAIGAIQIQNINTLAGNAKKSLSEEAKEIAAGIKDRRNEIKDRVTEIQKQYFPDNVPEPKEQAELLQADMSLLGEMACSLLDTFADKKREHRMIDYSDLEHIAYRVLREDQAEDAPSDVAKRYQAQYKEIFVDEYQDTNQIQESILKLVSGAWNGTPNIFMVGDVKQSVYGFRQACPDLFLEKYTHYRDVFEGQGDTNGKRICLYMNFRSRSAVLDTVNQIFRGIMHENTCGMEYTPAEYLNYGADYYDRVQLSETDPRPNPRTEIVLINHKDFADKRMPELHEVARRIETLIEEGYPVYDRQTNGLRPIRYSDICILLRSVKHTGKDFQDYFISRNIPTLCPEEEDFFARPEVQVMLSFLKVLDNPSQDIPLLAVLRNVYGVTDSEFAQVKLEVPGKDLSFWDRVQAYGKKNGGLLDRCVQRIYALRAESRDSTMGRLVWKCMHENNFFDALLAMPNGVVARQNLLLFMNRAVGYDTNINKGLYTFVNRMETLAKSTKNVPASGSVEDGLNAVRIMTIHGSKGLEFPVVFLCNTGSGRNKRDEGNKMLLHRSLGFGPTCYDRNKKLLFSSIMRLAVRQQKALDAKAEELRVLYVALTRAKEKLIITGSISKEANVYVEEKKQCCDLAKGMPMDYYVLHSDSFLSLMVMALCTHFSDSYKIQPAHYTEELDAFNSANVETPEVTFELPFVAPYQGLSGEAETARTIAPAKVSVSQLGELERPSFYPETPARKSTEQDDTEGGARVGTLVHSALQRVDYARLSQNREEMERYGEELLQTMVEDGFMTEAERALVPKQILVDYFTSDFALRLHHADWILREVPFTFLRPWKELSGEDLPGETAVQGVMDCVAQIEGKLVLIDFKSDRVSEDFEAYSKRYHTQISVYNEACLRAFGKAPDEVYLYYLRKHHPERILL